MLQETEPLHTWRMNFVTSVFTGPAYKQLSEKLGITRPEFVILYCLKHASGLVAQDICRVTGQPKNSISRAVLDLLNKGYIACGRDLADKRAESLSLIDEGVRVLDLTSPILRARLGSMRSALSEEELAQFDHLLLEMVFAMPN